MDLPVLPLNKPHFYPQPVFSCERRELSIKGVQVDIRTPPLTI